MTCAKPTLVGAVVNAGADKEAKEGVEETPKASEIQGDLNVKHIEIDASGASSIGVSGMANKMELYLSGASSFKGKGFLITDELLYDASGASSGHCQSDGDMFVKLSGASKLTYHD